MYLLSEYILLIHSNVYVGHRTGTDSMKRALNILGFGDMYHMKDLLRGHHCTHDHMKTVWASLARGRGNYNVTEIRELLACFDGGLDYPVSPFFRELMEMYPSAKVSQFDFDKEGLWPS